MSLRYTSTESPVGKLKLVASDDGLAGVLWTNGEQCRLRLPSARYSDEDALLCEAAGQLAEYFAGGRHAFDLPLDPQGTPFQKAVWQALRAIPYGETRSYLELARQLDQPQAARAVGAANGRNPLSIVVPCHRVIGAGGKLTGFAGGLAAKAHLLALEASKRRLFV